MNEEEKGNALTKDTHTPRLEVTGLGISFNLGGRMVQAIENISFSVAGGETLALVGESGCGKSLTCLAIMGLLPSPPARMDSGQIKLAGREIANLPEKALRRIRGREVAMIFQEPMTSFDPVYTIGYQLVEAVLAHENIDPDAASLKAEKAMTDVGLPDPVNLMNRYPHELSGGMKQRAMIAMALLENPGLILCDEPTTALDVTIQAQIMELLTRLRDERGVSILFITHNLGLVAGFAHRAAVMYAGAIVEVAEIDPLYAKPLHPYTIGLFASVPRLSSVAGERLASIPGTVPGLGEWPTGCRFAPRCDRAQAICRADEPKLEDKGNGRLCACHFA